VTVRVAHVGCKGLPSKGGTERVVEAIAVRHARSHEVTVYGRLDTCHSGIHDGVKVVALWTPRNRFLGPLWLATASALHVLWSGGTDVVHVHGSENSFVTPLLRLRFPVITTNHGPAHERHKWGRFARAMIRSTEKGSVTGGDAATAVSRAQAQSLSARYGVEIEYIPNGIDEDTLPDVEGARRVLAEVGLEPQAFAMFAAARVDPTKGCLTLLQAWRTLGCPQPLLILGDLWHAPGHESQLREAAEGMDVRFVPRLDDKAIVLGLLASADVFVFPSTIEAMSMMLLEATAVGVPVLASSIPENTDVLPDDSWFFAPDDAEDLARAYRALKAEPLSAVSDVCSKRSDHVRAHYSWDRIADQYSAVYDRVILARARKNRE
jgi:glycosyltransferase involved in cell wall biosynthesis